MANPRLHRQQLELEKSISMQFKENKPPRRFKVGAEKQIEISDCGKITLEPSEMVSFVHQGKEHDFTAKEWGFYATPSINGRAVREGFKTALVKNPAGMHFVMSVNTDFMESFERYLADEKQEVMQWLDQL